MFLPLLTKKGLIFNEAFLFQWSHIASVIFFTALK